MDKLLDVGEVRDYLKERGIDRSELTIVRWISNGALRAVKLPTGPKGMVRVPETELERFLSVPYLSVAKKEAEPW